MSPGLSYESESSQSEKNESSTTLLQRSPSQNYYFQAKSLLVKIFFIHEMYNNYMGTIVLVSSRLVKPYRFKLNSKCQLQFLT